ncbi:uncharacterized protein LOC112271167 isoform X2 [Brachypodium distachyon]|uniref:uncharacterized protein LOC112271167 isoform X2 n=1 Tax=Brachypodium distachyon TaxID=15368 RepID=UPI000D0D2BD8|nr:uncharacterized protein LOC112271167 isoform X2 [Brachypodium distachyon]|eukprot:XP_024316006.1 uncharacterized protein LOC112271167 isoform X2 [Brachypodium distachyon]
MYCGCEAVRLYCVCQKINVLREMSMNKRGVSEQSVGLLTRPDATMLGPILLVIHFPSSHAHSASPIHMSEEGGGTKRRRGSSPAAPASLPDDYDLLREILLRLPPQPSSLPRASVVCKLWRAVTTDPKFLQCFRAHHRKPPLLGYFGAAFGDKVEIVFRPTLDHPDRIPPERFSLRGCSRRENYVLGCRHGRVLVDCPAQKEVVVCEPISGGQRRVAVPPEFKNGFHDGAVLCAAGDQGHVHGGCHSCPFKVVLLCMPEEDNRALACVYSSETGIMQALCSL